MPWIVAVYPHFQAHPNNIMLIMYPMINPVKFTLYYHNIKMMIPLKLYIYVQWNTLARPESPTKLKRCWTWWRQRGHRTCSPPPFRWKYGAFTSYHVVSPCFLCFAWGDIDCSDFWWFLISFPSKLAAPFSDTRKYENQLGYSIEYSIDMPLTSPFKWL